MGCAVDFSHRWITPISGLSQATELLPLVQPVCDRARRPRHPVSTHWGTGVLHWAENRFRGPASASESHADLRVGLPTNSPRGNLPGRGGIPATAPRPTPATPVSHLVPARPADQRGTRREVLLELRVRVLLAAVATACRATPGHLERRRFCLTHRRARLLPYS